MEDAKGKERVLITIGTPLTLQEATWVNDKIWVVYHNDSKKRFNYISYFEDHFFGFSGTEYDSLNQQDIKAIFADKSLKVKFYNQVFDSLDQTWGIRAVPKSVKAVPEVIDRTTVFEIHDGEESKEEREARVAYGILIALLAIILTPLLIALLVKSFYGA